MVVVISSCMFIIWREFAISKHQGKAMKTSAGETK
jgi:hypothetical protein